MDAPDQANSHRNPSTPAAKALLSLLAAVSGCDSGQHAAQFEQQSDAKAERRERGQPPPPLQERKERTEFELRGGDEPPELAVETKPESTDPTLEPAQFEQPPELVQPWAGPTPSFTDTQADAMSTFSIDVDTASYTRLRRSLLAAGRLPSPDGVRTEELINYFDYDYPAPSGEQPFSITTEVGPAPWDGERRLVHVGLRGREPTTTPARNLVFLVDVSGSMRSDDKLPLVRYGLTALTGQLGSRDRVAIVTYAGNAGTLLEPTAGDQRETILAALEGLQSGGSTHGSAGIETAYALAEQNFIEGGNNRVILATDGDFNVGISSEAGLIELIEAKRESGVFLSVLGFGDGPDGKMEQIADHGNGNYAFIDSPFEARKVLVDEARATLDTIAKDVKIQVEFDPRFVASHRLIGYDNRVLADRDFADDRKDAGEIGAGHTVTALFEITPTGTGSADEPIMRLDLRYKQPEGDQSALISVPVHDRGRAGDESSEDFRFSAAVAGFGQKLAGVDGRMSYADILELASGAVGDDRSCFRHQFLEMVWVAARESGENLASVDSACEPRTDDPELDALLSGIAPRTDWATFVLRVLLLTPPFLALPLFVRAARRRRRAAR